MIQQVNLCLENHPGVATQDAFYRGGRGDGEARLAFIPHLTGCIDTKTPARMIRTIHKPDRETVKPQARATLFNGLSTKVINRRELQKVFPHIMERAQAFQVCIRCIMRECRYHT
jgi:hypothetical protein